MRGLGLSTSYLLALATFGAASVAACGADPAREGDEAPVEAASDGGSRAPDGGKKRDAYFDDCGQDNPFCLEPEAEPPPPECPSERFDLRPAGVNVVVAVDGSKSMTSFWPQIRTAVTKMVADNPDAKFGADLFWADVVDTVEDGFARLNACGDTQHKKLAIAANQSAAIAPLFGETPPGPGVFFYDFTVVADALNHYLVTDTGLSDPSSTNYLVLVSDGNDNCFGNFFAGDEDKRLAFEKLTRELVKKNIRVLPIGFNGASDQLTLTGDETNTDFTALDTIAKHGGTGITKALAADDPAELAMAIDAISRKIASCRFAIPAAEAGNQRINPFELTFWLNGVEVARDRTNGDGWNFVAGDVAEVELFGAACDAVRAGVELEARRSCDTTEICGTAASKVSAKTRAVQYLLDRSFSMADCSTGFLGCLPGLTPGLTWWGVAASAIANSVSAPLNDDVEFGLKYFPDATDSACLVSDGAAVAPSSSTSIQVIGDVLHRLPTGSTPLLAGLESVARSPGRLAEADVSGAVIVVSDGGESCEPIDQATKVARLTAAARSLGERGIKVFAVRFGTRGADFADQDAQLRAIVKSGGTATGDPDDPNNVPYLDAPDAMALNVALAGISQELSSCALQVGELDKDADRSQINLYLDGDVVRFDRNGSKADGWGWVDAARTEMELYGATCAQFKTSRTTSIVVEAGCESVFVQ